MSNRNELYSDALEFVPANVRGSGEILGIECAKWEFESLGCELFAIIGVRSVKRNDEIGKYFEERERGFREREREILNANQTGEGTGGRSLNS